MCNREISSRRIDCFFREALCPDRARVKIVTYYKGRQRAKLPSSRVIRPGQFGQCYFEVENLCERDYPTLFKVVFQTEVVCQEIQHVPLVMLVTFPKNIA